MEVTHNETNSSVKVGDETLDRTRQYNEEIR